MQVLYSELAGMVVDGRLTSEIEAVYPLSRVKETVAPAELEARGGKIVLSMTP